MANRFVILNNEKSVQNGFDRQRNMKGSASKEDEDELPKVIAEFQKERLRILRANFYIRRKKRENNRTVKLSGYIELIKIQFFKVFDTTLRKDFFDIYGLSPVEYSDFNKTVLFEIDDQDKFNLFIQHVGLIVESKEKTTYHGKDYNRLALMYRFEFFDSRRRIMTFRSSGILLSLVSTNFTGIYRNQKQVLLQQLEERGIEYSYSDNNPDIIEIHKAASGRLLINWLADNFDIVKAITSSRTERIRPGIAGPVREYGFEVEVPDGITTVGIIDTGITKIEPLKDVVVDEFINHTPHAPFWEEAGHGTLVAGLVTLGDDFYLSTQPRYRAKAKLFNIKALHFSNDDLDIPRLINDIRVARREMDIKVFNMSLVIPNAKRYNSSYSQFAYELDRLAHEEDLIIFLAVGNFDSESLESILVESDHPAHEYPYFFYSPDSDSDSHRCEDTNICVPSESLNNISVGALAGNFDATDTSDLTPVAFYPAYYSRKFHHDYSRQINKSDLKQKNAYLNKPDFVMNGGDVLNYKSGMQILRAPFVDAEKFYGWTCGTSLATPLLASYAAEILHTYPGLSVQTIKALLINSASYYEPTRLEHFKDQPSRLLKSLVGFGQPKKEFLLGTGPNSVQFIVEDSIRVNYIKKIPIYLPEYLLNSKNKLQFDVALSFSFDPVKDNHLDYLPLYMAFNIVKDVSIREVAKKQQDYGIKGSFSWSEDHFGIDNRLFSNAQKKSYRLQPDDIVSVDGAVAVGIRCLAKKNYETELSRKAHKFSLVVRVTELISNRNENSQELYTEMLAINNYINIDATLDTDLEAEL